MPSSPLFYLLALVVLFPSKAMSDGGDDLPNNQHYEGSIGAIVDDSSRVGKEEKVAMEMAIEDFYNSTRNRLLLHVRYSRRDPLQAAFAAMDLINEKGVQAIIGVRSWEEAALVAELGNRAHVPILAFTEATPQWASERWPFLVQAIPSTKAQMRAVAAIVGSWGWRKVTVIYEDIDSAAGVISHIGDAIREVGSEIDELFALPPYLSSSSSLTEDIERLKTSQCRVFVVHSSFPVAAHLFAEAKKMGMMEKEYVWITTDGFTSLIGSVNSTVISSMQGVVGVRSYYSQTGTQFRSFSSKFRGRFHSEYPEEENLEPGIFALQAYDAVCAVAMAMERRNELEAVVNSKDKASQKLLKEILLSQFEGLTSKIHFTEGQLAPVSTFQIINVAGKSYREVGFWTEGLGFSERKDEGEIYHTSISVLGQVYWPGGPWSVPRGWALPTSVNPLRVGVPVKPTFNQFVKVSYDHSCGNWCISGFSVEVFKATVERLPYHLPYEFIPFKGTYDSLVERIHNKTLGLGLKNLDWLYAWEKTLDAVVGDTTIVAKRCKYAEFTQPYTESGLLMIVNAKFEGSNKAWLFMKPFTKRMWALTVVITVYNGLVVWLIERKDNSDFRGPAYNQVGTFLWLSFTTLFSLHGERLNSNLSRMTMVVWLFASLVITQSYSASLTSMLTVQRLEPDVDSLKNMNVMVGCSKRSFVVKYLEEVLYFNPNLIKKIDSEDEFAQALRSGEIKAAFLESAYAKLLLAKYCKEFAVVGQTYKVGGFGFVFPKGSPMLPDISEAILKISESGKLRELENNLISSNKCSNADVDQGSLSPNSFWGLFIITGGTSTIALTLFGFHQKWYLDLSTQATLVYKNVRGVMLALMKYLVAIKSQRSNRIICAESQEHAPNMEVSSMPNPEMEIQVHGLESGTPN